MARDKCVARMVTSTSCGHSQVMYYVICDKHLAADPKGGTRCRADQILKQHERSTSHKCTVCSVSSGSNNTGATWGPISSRHRFVSVTIRSFWISQHSSALATHGHRCYLTTSHTNTRFDSLTLITPYFVINGWWSRTYFFTPPLCFCGHPFFSIFYYSPALTTRRCIKSWVVGFL